MFQKLFDTDADVDTDADTDTDADADARCEEACSGSQILMLMLMLTSSFSLPDRCCSWLFLLFSFLRRRCHRTTFRRGCVRAGDGVEFWWP